VKKLQENVMIKGKPDAEILRNYEATLYPDKGGG